MKERIAPTWIRPCLCGCACEASCPDGRPGNCVVCLEGDVWDRSGGRSNFGCRRTIVKHQQCVSAAPRVDLQHADWTGQEISVIGSGALSVGALFCFLALIPVSAGAGRQAPVASGSACQERDSSRRPQAQSWQSAGQWPHPALQVPTSHCLVV